MAVYVDDMRARYGRMVMCHMAADTEDELHQMADRIGVARKWYQGDHYDICRAKKKLAIQFGAKKVTRREMVQIVRGRQGECSYPDCGCAEARLCVAVSGANRAAMTVNRPKRKDPNA